MTLDEFLEHYGIKGMQWGVRRKRGSSGRVSSDYSTSRKLTKKKTSQLSNEELTKLKSRLKLEAEVARLSPTAGAKGKRLFGRALNVYESALIGAVAGGVAANMGKFILKKVGA
jgi:hypothetical protein